MLLILTSFSLFIQVFWANVLNQDTQTLRCVRHGILRIVVFLLFHYFYLHVRLVEQDNRSQIQLR